MQNGCCICKFGKNTYINFIYKFVSLLTRVITVHKTSKIHLVNYATINAIHIFILVVITATYFCLLWPFIAVNRLQQQKNVLQRKSEK